MKIAFPIFIKYTISDLSETTILQTLNISELRKKVEILIIDDEEPVALPFLRQNGFHITHKFDIDNINDVSSYSIILCDIRGVGNALGSSRQGAFVIKEIKRRYPDKQVIAYTGSSYDPSYNNDINLADHVISKGIALDDWVSIIDSQIEKVISPIFQWNRLRKSLLDCGASTIYVAKLEDRYVRAIKSKNFSSLQKLANETDEKTRTIVSDFLVSVCAKVILGVL